MNDPRHGVPRIRSPPEKIRVHRSEWNLDPHLPPGGSEIRKKILSRPLRSLSPPVRRMLSGDHRGKTIERGDIDTGDDCVHPRSPTYIKTLKWSQFDEGFQSREGVIMRRNPPSIENQKKYLVPDIKDLNANANTNMKHIGGSRPSGSRIPEDKNFHGISSSISGRGVSIQKSIYLDDRSGPERSYFRPPPDIGPTLNPGKISRKFPTSPPRNLDIGFHEDEELRYVDNLRRRKLPSRVPYKEDNEQLYLRDVPDSMRVISRSKIYGGTSSGISEDEFLACQDDLHLSSYGFGKKQRNYTGPVRQDGYGQAPPSDFARDPELESTFYHQDLPSPTRDEHEHKVYRYSGYSRMERDNPEYHSDEVYRKMPASARQDYASRDSLRPTHPGSVVGRFEYIESTHTNRDSGLRVRDNHSLPGEHHFEYMEKRRISTATERDRDFLGSGSNHFQFRTKVTREGEGTHPEGDYGFAGDASHLSYKGRMRRLQMSECDQDICRLDLSPKRISRAEESDIYDPPERMLKRKYVIAEETSGHNTRNIILTSRNASRRVQELNVQDKQWTSEDPGEIPLSKRLKFGQLQLRKAGRPYDGTIASRLSASDDWVSSDDLPVHVQRRSVGGYTPSDGIKGRLRPPSSYHDSHPLDRKNNIYKPNKYWKRNLDNQYGGLPTDEGDPLEDMVTPAKPEPPEDSEEFKQLVDSSFFRFSKLLNENPHLRRRFKEQGYAGSFFCNVCARNSKEFMDTRSLVTHTFMSRKLGLRSDHLGFHKALCVLMGWNSTVAPNGACLYQVLPEAYAMTLKEDLVLWPPVVVIHNSSIGNHSFDEQKVVSLEQMEAILIEMGFSGGMIKVRHGKPGNQSIMVVKFLGTFSGLQEAERLHQYYIENKRGRKEFQQVVSTNFNGGNEEAEGDKAKVLYGYMGVAEDLEKLDYETKKRCVVKSKKDIQAIADAPLKEE